MANHDRDRQDAMIIEWGPADETVDSDIIGEEPEAYFQEYIRRADLEFLKYGKIGGDMTQIVGDNASNVVKKRIAENDPHITGDKTFVDIWNNRQEHADKHQIMNKIIDRSENEIFDSELARAYFDDEIAELEEERLRLIEESNRLESDSEIEYDEERYLEIAGLIEETNKEIEDIKARAGMPDEKKLSALESKLYHLQQIQLQNKYGQASEAVVKNQEQIQFVTRRLLKFEALRDNVEISGKEARDIEEVKARLAELPNIKFNEERGQLLADKLKDYEGRVKEGRKDIYGLDAKLKFDILSRLFRDEEINPFDLAEEMGMKTLRDYEGLERAARVIQDYTETGGLNVEQR